MAPLSLESIINGVITVGNSVSEVVGGNTFFGGDAAATFRSTLQEMQQEFQNRLDPVSSVARPTDENIVEQTITLNINGFGNKAQPFLVPFDQQVRINYTGVANAESSTLAAVADGVAATLIRNVNGNLQEVEGSRLERSGIARLPLQGETRPDDINVTTQPLNLKAGVYVLLGTIVGHELSEENSSLTASLVIEKPADIPDEAIDPLEGIPEEELIGEQDGVQNGAAVPQRSSRLPLILGISVVGGLIFFASQ
jgi:hypothetical protein